jgi:hypothetical protein
MTGFITDDGYAWGRPVGIAAGADGSLYVSDDGSNTVWRVRKTARGSGIGARGSGAAVGSGRPSFD